MKKLKVEPSPLPFATKASILSPLILLYTLEKAELLRSTHIIDLKLLFVSIF